MTFFKSDVAIRWHISSVGGSKPGKVIHELGAKVIYHSDGAGMEAVPGLIDMGIVVRAIGRF